MTTDTYAPAELSEYPCGNQNHKCRDYCRDLVDAGTTGCFVLPIFRAHIKLRRAVLGEMTPEEAAALYRRASECLLYTQDTLEDGNKLWGLADVVAKL